VVICTFFFCCLLLNFFLLLLLLLAFPLLLPPHAVSPCSSFAVLLYVVVQDPKLSESFLESSKYSTYNTCALSGKHHSLFVFCVCSFDRGCLFLLSVCLSVCLSVSCVSCPRLLSPANPLYTLLNSVRCRPERVFGRAWVQGGFATSCDPVLLETPCLFCGVVVSVVRRGLVIPKAVSSTPGVPLTSMTRRLFSTA